MTKIPRRKIEMPFHPLTAELAKEWYSKNYLTTTGYLVAIKSIIRPPGVELKINNVVAFCEEWGISKSAFYRAVDALKDEFEWEATHGIVLRERSITTDVVEFPQNKSVPHTGHSSHKRDAKSRKRDSDSHERDSDSRKRDTQSHERDIQDSEPSQDNNSSTPQTIQTYSDFIQTLSDEERASFLNFCLEKTKNLSQEVNDIEAWLAHTTKAGQNRWEVYYEKFTSHQQKQISKSKTNLNSQFMKKFTEEVEQKCQQARENWQKSQAESCETGGTA